MHEKLKKFFAQHKVFTTLAALFLLNIVLGIYLPKLSEARNQATFENAQCNVPDGELKKADIEKIGSCTADTDCVFVPISPSPDCEGWHYSINREFVCVDKMLYSTPTKFYGPPKAGHIDDRSLVTSCNPFDYSVTLPAFSAIESLLQRPACIQGHCQAQ